GLGDRAADLIEISLTRSGVPKKASFFSGGLAPLRIVPQRVHLFERRGPGRLAALGQPVLDELEAALELRSRVDERVLGVDAELASEVHDGEQEIAELAVDRGRVAGPRRRADLVDLLADLVERALPARPVEADLRHLRPDLLRPGEGGAGLHAIEDAAGLR